MIEQESIKQITLPQRDKDQGEDFSCLMVVDSNNDDGKMIKEEHKVPLNKEGFQNQQELYTYTTQEEALNIPKWLNENLNHVDKIIGDTINSAISHIDTLIGGNNFVQQRAYLAKMLKYPRRSTIDELC